MSSVLTIHDHNRHIENMTYVYPVVSRRAKGVSIGINLNTNNACNWACIYCQVENLTRGGPPSIDIELLARELSAFLAPDFLTRFLETRVAPEMRRVADIAFAGNGEPTTAPEFKTVVERVIAILLAQVHLPTIPIRLITNGSQLHRVSVQEGIKALGQAGGEVWFKVDRATESGIALVNQTQLSIEKISRNLKHCCELAPTWIQTCWFPIDGHYPDSAETQAYIDFVAEHQQRIQGIHLYGIARPSQQAGAEHLGQSSAEELKQFAAKIQAISNIPVQIAI